MSRRTDAPDRRTGVSLKRLNFLFNLISAEQKASAVVISVTMLLFRSALPLESEIFCLRKSNG
eukprot:767390-Hanusia_phi.AAC.1